MANEFTLAELLKLLRGSTTLRELEAATGLSNAYLSQLECGKGDNPSVDVLRKLIAQYPKHREQILQAVGLA